MEKKYDIFLSCDDAQHCCDKTQYNEASLLEKIKLNIHLIYCKACRTYTKKNTKLTKVLNRSTSQTMENSEKQSLEELFKKELSNQN